MRSILPVYLAKMTNQWVSCLLPGEADCILRSGDIQRSLGGQRVETGVGHSANDATSGVVQGKINHVNQAQNNFYISLHTHGYMHTYTHTHTNTHNHIYIIFLSNITAFVLLFEMQPKILSQLSSSTSSLFQLLHKIT